MEAWAVPPEAAPGRRPLEAAKVRTALLSARGLQTATDAYLVSLVRQGRTGAFDAIYERYQRPILTFCRHTLGDPDEAADAVQHTFLAAYNAIVSSPKTILLRAWLFTIARNRCYSVLRARRQQATGQLVEMASDGLAAEVLKREDLRQLCGDLRRLPEHQRAAIVLTELGALSHQEVAEVLGVPTSKVKALVFQARESLIAMRVARETDCSVIREQLATLRGGALRRGNLRRHLGDCPACREFRDQLAHRRDQLSAVSAPTP
jgi:RNA polymerase sigma factor (sigma-70 family)